jgi:hypothetical protein
VGKPLIYFRIVTRTHRASGPSTAPVRASVDHGLRVALRLTRTELNDRYACRRQPDFRLAMVRDLRFTNDPDRGEAAPSGQGPAHSGRVLKSTTPAEGQSMCIRVVFRQAAADGTSYHIFRVSAGHPGPNRWYSLVQRGKARVISPLTRPENDRIGPDPSPAAERGGRPSRCGPIFAYSVGKATGQAYPVDQVQPNNEQTRHSQPQSHHGMPSA